MEQINLPDWEKQSQPTSKMGKDITMNAKQHRAQHEYLKQKVKLSGNKSFSHLKKRDLLIF